MKRFLLAPWLAMLCALPSLAVHADTTTGAMAASSNVVAACTLQTPTINFFTYKIAQQSTSSGLFVATCTKKVVFTVTVDQGVNAQSGSTCAAPVRAMKGPANSFLVYSMQNPASASKLWGCDVSSNFSATSSSGLNGSAFSSSVTIAAGQDVPAGSYVDTVTATVSF